MNLSYRINYLLARTFCIVFLSFYALTTYSNSIVINQEIEKEDISRSLLFFEDFEGQLTAKDIIERLHEFKSSGQKVTNLGATSTNHWALCAIENQTNITTFLLQIESPLLCELEIYELNSATTFQLIYKFNMNQSSYARKYNHPNHIVDISVGNGESKKFLFQFKSGKELIMPVSIGSQQGIVEANNKKDIVFGVFTGIVLIMFLYNLFIYFSVRDKSYLYYVIYVFFLGLTQNILQGYDFKYLYFLPWLAQRTIYFCGALVGIAVILFLMSFLNTKQTIPKLHRFLYLIIGGDLIALLLAVFGVYNLSYQLIDATAGLGSLYVLFVVIKLSIEGNRSAKLFLIAWSIFLIGVVIFVLRSQNILPYNNFTNYTMLVGAAIETLLLSFALADRINIMRFEKLEAQQKTVEVLRENQKIISEQNIILEQKVEERTTELNQTLNHLKQAQSQLVDAEKMSSLGQLTAGIAHEINNPINFVAANITPLRQDLKDINTLIKKYEEITISDDLEEKLNEIEQLKKELDFEYLKTELVTIIDGIEDGAKRTTEIVSGLRNFSRLDESELKVADINEGIESTLTLLKNKLTGIDLIKELNPLPLIECYPGKLNQLFMNIINNAIQAVELLIQESKKGKIKISSQLIDSYIVISMSDNGVGMDETTKEKIFEPFFTTKDVGKGTGLGLSIAFSIIEIHHGKIEVISKIGEGTTFKIKLPLKQQ